MPSLRKFEKLLGEPLTDEQLQAKREQLRQMNAQPDMPEMAPSQEQLSVLPPQPLPPAPDYNKPLASPQLSSPSQMAPAPTLWDKLSPLLEKPQQQQNYDDLVAKQRTLEFKKIFPGGS